MVLLLIYALRGEASLLFIPQPTLIPVISTVGASWVGLLARGGWNFEHTSTLCQRFWDHLVINPSLFKFHANELFNA